MGYITQTAHQIMNDESKRRKMDDTWLSVTHDEMKVYYALCILMTLVKKSNIQMYWSNREVIETPITKKVMPFKRFRQISRLLHFSDNETTDNNDRLRKVKPVITFWKEKFNKIYTLGKNINITNN